ncbi:MAG TPA: TetR/AcrR family transcriptional regulator [Candidatus Angelobacter sp.]|nr:TetR/AcrR family transcriptional regulator [Candidatus Angelobacter sp.]
MPKIAKDRIEQNQRRIEAAALKLFTRQGFHGTNIREIAEKIGVSTGAIYTYYPSKEAIFASLVRGYRARIDAWRKQICERLKEPLSKNGLRTLGAEIRKLVYRDPEYLLLLYIDVVEFKNQHFTETFHDVPEQFRRMLAPRLREARQDAGWQGPDPAFVLASAYLYFFTYAGIEKLYRGNRHMGVSDDQAAQQFAELLCRGLWESGGDSAAEGDQKPTAHLSKAEIHALHKPALDRIGLMRLLSGRLWSAPPDVPSDGAQSKVAPMLFIPQITRSRIDHNQIRVEAAALDLFTRQGFHSTKMREIAEEAEVSSGSIYTYYASKEALYESLVKNYRACMRVFREKVFCALENPFSRDDLRLLALAVRSMVYHDAEYQLLTFIDIIEFRNQHFADTFYKLPEQFRRVLAPALNKVKKEKGWCGLDPAFALAAIYLYFFTYFVIERLMHGNQHLGVSDGQAIEQFIDVLSRGLWGAAEAQGRQQVVNEEKAAAVVLDTAEPTEKPRRPPLSLVVSSGN